ncbi:MAG: oxidoreductase [Syntrophobacterales bacterium CG_4_9_14_3_um_filter_49_8]|nr:MAG: oxidoreductase [Syntrophobacterales bacterium CG23_combo_of_CG06-09_8_20_14_all_48_27]PJA47582.1 MAG: oxidoreductase [Syntrophobacterales bacterium CG_4_9_14_3_um_filter_49_8]
MERNIAVVGAGFWGKNLVRNFYELGVLHTICDADKKREGEYRLKYPDTDFTQFFSQVLDDPQIDGVVVSTPASYHYEMAREALLAGKHVFVEKPLALQVDEGKELVKLARERVLVLMVGHILQYHPAIERLKALIEKGELGKIQYIYSNRLNIGKIRSEENILWSFAPHDISVILFLLNESPETLYATGGSYLQHQIPDITITTMDFKSGVKAHIFVSWLHPFKEQKLVIVGDRKMAVFDDVSKEKLYLYPHRIEWKGRIPVASKAEAEIVPIEMEEPLKIECRHFIECIQNNQTPKTDGYEGLRILEILQAFQESLNQGGARIKLNKLKKLREPEKSSYFVHESSYIDEDVEIGEGTKIWHFSHILRGSRIGRNCRIGQNVVIGPDVTIGDGCKIQNNVSVYEGVTLEDEVFCGPSMVFTNVFNPRSAIPRMDELRPTLIKKGATIGANATIICGHTIGRYAFIGAGAVVTKDVPDYALVASNPGKIIGWICECGVRLNFDDKATGRCKTCNRIYEKINEVTLREKIGDV